MDLEKLNVLESIASRIDSELTLLKNLIREQYELNKARERDMINFISQTNSTPEVPDSNDITLDIDESIKIEINDVAFQSEQENEQQEFILSDNYPTETALVQHQGLGQDQQEIEIQDFAQDHQKHKVSTSKGLNQNRLVKHQRTRKNTQKITDFMCQICHKYFKTRTILNQHKEIHSNSKNHLCTYCLKYFTTRHSLRSHIYRIHRSKLGTLPYKCTNPDCEERFGTEKGLENHLEVSHRKLNCEKCGKLYFSEIALIGHLAGVHFICCRKTSGCGQQFTNRIQLASHRKNHHPKT